jgi:hypothetical protein
LADQPDLVRLDLLLFHDAAKSRWTAAGLLRVRRSALGIRPPAPWSGLFVSPDARQSLQARAPRGKETRSSKLVLRKQRNKVSNHSRVAPNETHSPVGRNVGNPYDRQNNLRFGTERSVQSSQSPRDREAAWRLCHPK